MRFLCNVVSTFWMKILNQCKTKKKYWRQMFTKQDTSETFRNFKNVRNEWVSECGCCLKTGLSTTTVSLNLTSTSIWKLSFTSSMKESKTLSDSLWKLWITSLKKQKTASLNITCSYCSSNYRLVKLSCFMINCYQVKQVKLPVIHFCLISISTSKRVPKTSNHQVRSCTLI